jgi:MoxR-like ATPase
MNDVATLSLQIHREMDRVIVGQRELKTQCLVALLCRGHALLEGVPGIAKTLTVKTLARLLGLGFQRVQATSDLMPADIIGTNVVALGTGVFTLHKGPAFTDLLLVDEINRMPPRTQAALLECMEEGQITIDGTRHGLSPAFTVFATQNPIDFEGTYPLPEAQLDRFFVKILIGYPAAEEESALLSSAHRGLDRRDLDRLDLVPVAPGLLDAARADVQRVTVQDSLFDYIVRLVRQTREWPAVTLGASPRAALSVMHAAKALAALDGREYVVPDDAKGAIVPVLRHRLIVKPEADLEGITADQILREVGRTVEVPR